MTKKPYLIKNQFGRVKCKFLFAFFAALLILMGNSQAYADEEPKSITQGGLVYTVLDDGESASVKAASKDISGDITILDKVTIGDKEYPVIEIEDKGFYVCNQITSVTIPEFVTKIGEYAFFGCGGLESVSIGEGVTKIGYYAFCYCNFTEVTLPQSLTELGTYAFSNCQFLSEINIPKNLSKIDDAVFKGSKQLTKITIDKDNNFYSLTTDGFFLENKSKTIAYIGKEPTVVIPDGIETIGECTFAACNAVEFIIPNSVKTIKQYAFDICSNMKYITIPNSVTSIEEYAFSFCNFTSVTIPSSLITLNFNTFYGCDNLQTVYVENIEKNENNETGFTWEGEKSDYESYEIVYLTTPLSDYDYTVTLPDGITATGEDITTFGDRVYVKSRATLTLSQPEEYGYSFIVPKYGCSFDETNLRLSNITADINIALNVPDITYVLDDDDVEVRVLNNDISGDIIIPEQVTINGSKYSVTIIPPECFKNCTGITSISIPNSVYYIGRNAFDGCTNLKTITIDNYKGGIRYLGCKFPDNVEVIYSRQPDYFAFTQIGNTNTVMVKFGGKPLSGAIVIPATTTIDVKVYRVVEIAEMGFAQQAGITSVTIPDGVTFIGNNAFAACTKLTTVSIPSTVTDIVAPFGGCSSLKNVNIADGSPFSFNNGFLIKNITENGTVTEKVLVGYYGNDVNVAVPDGVTTIAEYAFVNNTSMESLFIPSSVKLVYDFRFMGGRNIKSIYVDNSEKVLPEETVGVLESYKNQSIDVYYLKDIEGIKNAVCYVSIPSGFTAQGEGIKTVGNRVYLNENITSFKLAYTSSEPLPDGSKLIADDNNITITEQEDGYLVSKIKGNAEIILDLPIFSFQSIEPNVAAVYAYKPQTLSGVIEIPSTCTINNENFDVKAIGYGAFNQSGITSVTIPEGFEAILQTAFGMCYALSSVTLPESLTYISDNAFRMSGISSITIPKKVTTVGKNAFTDCSNLKTIYVQQNPNTLLENAGVPTDCKVIFLGEDENIMYNINQNYIFNGEYEGSMAMPTFSGDQKNQNVSLKRTFIPGVYSTIILPFEINNADECGEFYTFKGVNYDKTLGQWVADVELVTKPQANTPYLFKASTPLPEFTNGLTTIKATPSSLSTTNGKWTLTGTYQYIQWKNGASNVYGFAGEPSTDAEGNDIEIGEFVQAGAGASINPFRCYLEHKGDGLSKRNTNLPESIIVRVVQPDETESIEQPEPTEPTEIITPVTEISEQISAKAWSYNGTIYIESQPGTDYQIIDLSGRVIKIGVTHSTREEVTLNRNAGVLLVVINGKTFKILY